ncbi:MAG: hypothetical protein Q9181_004383, partial [Wetmoreana brouardii]
MTHSPPDTARQFPGGMKEPDDLTPRCCCGRHHCLHLEHNDTALRNLENDLRRAAEAGQSLLARHEAYVFEAEEERRKMAASINRLECDKKELEAASAITVEENRSLLDQLENLNRSVSTSDAHIASLNATLQSTRHELDKVTALAARASHLEAQLSLMEVEQVGLNEKLALREADQRSAIERWRDAERTINALQEQVDRIDAEARDERERHAESMGRFERRRAVERQLESAAGRLKGAAAATTLRKPSDGNNQVVSHFVKDILADNASLQMGIMELREMLMGSNEEVQNLRQQMMLHQEMPPDQQEVPRATLEKDLERSTPSEPDPVPALHVHHHYHEASKADQAVKQRPARSRKPRKKFKRVHSGTSTPRSGLETPIIPSTPSPQSMRAHPPSTAATILSQTSVTIPSPPQHSYSHRLSIQSSNTRSSFAPSSVPGSAHPSMFDFLSESSRPTSPDSVDALSPHCLAQRNKSSPRVTLLQPSGYHEGLSIQDRYFDDRDLKCHDSRAGYNTISERPVHDLNLPETFPTTGEPYSPCPGLRRSASHESILSVLPIPAKTLRHKQSHLFRGAAFKSRPSLTSSSPTTSIVPSKPVISATPITAAPSYQQSTAAARAVSASGAISTLTSTLSQAPASRSNNKNASLGNRVGGWVWGKWGVTPMASTDNLRARVREERPTGVNQKGSLKAIRSATNAVTERATGVDQVGSSKALKRSGKRLSTHVEPVAVDEVLLKESLGE